MPGSSTGPASTISSHPQELPASTQCKAAFSIKQQKQQQQPPTRLSNRKMRSSLSTSPEFDGLKFGTHTFLFYRAPKISHSSQSRDVHLVNSGDAAYAGDGAVVSILGDCAVGASAGCASLCCCCPLTIASLLGPAFVRLPRSVWRKRYGVKTQKEEGPKRYSDVQSATGFGPITTVNASGVVSPLRSPFGASSRGFGVFGDVELWDEIFEMGQSELVERNSCKDN
eukprot:c23396_g1_i2 orf=178-855(+)